VNLDFCPKCRISRFRLFFDKSEFLVSVTICHLSFTGELPSCVDQRKNGFFSENSVQELDIIGVVAREKDSCPLP